VDPEGLEPTTARL